ncbi:MAG: flavin reductase family protein [Bacteroidota bacterium]
MKSFIPQELKTAELHAFLLSAVAPRPISFASTINSEGQVNLSPFSFFNVYSSKPPIMVFSSNRSGKTGETKDTYKNIKEVPEVVINIVTYDMVQQASLASVAYPRGVNEFVKAGFTMQTSELIKPPRVAESPVQFECKVNQVIELGQEGGAGNLFICEIVKMHIHESVLNESGSRIDPLKMDQVGRCGDDYYVRLNDSSLFMVPKPVTTIGIGVDAIPSWIIQNHILTGNDLGMLGNVEQIPIIIQYIGKDSNENSIRLNKAKAYLALKQVEEAWKVLVQ